MSNNYEIDLDKLEVKDQDRCRCPFLHLVVTKGKLKYKITINPVHNEFKGEVVN